MAGHDSPTSLFLRFLKFGALAWGGPAAQIAAIHRECVVEQGWVSEETFKKTVAVYQMLPGPEATELCIYLGRIRGGKLGGLMAGLGFVLPGFLLMLALAVIAVAGFVLTLFGSVSFVLVLVLAALAYELWTNGAAWARRANSAGAGPVALLALAGTVSLSLTAEIFFEGL